MFVQNVGTVRQLLYDFPWTNVGKLVFVVSIKKYFPTFVKNIKPTSNTCYFYALQIFLIV